jgi:WD40 repeat protein
VTEDSTEIISITQNCQIGVFDFNSLELKREFGNPYSNANIDFALSPDNHLLAVAQKNKLELWDLSTGNLVKQYENSAYNVYAPRPEADWGYIYKVAFSPDGRFIGTQFNGSITTLWGVPLEKQP